MKLRKIFAALSAFAVSTAVMTSVCFAEGENATYCFDTADRVADWQLGGSSEEAGLKLTQTNRKAESGDGSLVVSVNIPSDISDGFGGAFIDASVLGLESFDGCTVSMSVMLCEGAEGHTENLSVYSDGIVWVEAAPESLSAEAWTNVSLTVPTGADNSSVGFTVPTFSAYSGDVVYIDNFRVVTPDGTAVANVGDYQYKTITSEDTVSGGMNIVLTIVLVVLILVIVAGIGFIVFSAIKKFR